MVGALDSVSWASSPRGTDARTLGAEPEEAARTAVYTQWPARQILAEQTLPQPPQFIGSFSMSVSQPSAGLPSQSAKPALQATMVQTPDEHVADAFGGVQALLQQKPPTQKPLTHWLLPLHGVPSDCFGLQVPLLQ